MTAIHASSQARRASLVQAEEGGVGTLRDASHEEVAEDHDEERRTPALEHGHGAY